MYVCMYIIVFYPDMAFVFWLWNNFYTSW